MYNRPLTQVSGRISVFIRALGVGRCKSVTVRVSDFFTLLESAQAWETRVRGAKKIFSRKRRARLTITESLRRTCTPDRTECAQIALQAFSVRFCHLYHAWSNKRRSHN